MEERPRTMAVPAVRAGLRCCGAAGVGLGEDSFFCQPREPARHGERAVSCHMSPDRFRLWGRIPGQVPAGVEPGSGGLSGSAAGTPRRGGAGRQVPRPACLPPPLRSLPGCGRDVCQRLCGTNPVLAPGTCSSVSTRAPRGRAVAVGEGTCGAGRARGVTSHRAESQSGFTVRAGKGLRAIDRREIEQRRGSCPPAATLSRAVLGRAAQPRDGSEAQDQLRRGETKPAPARHCFLSSCCLFLDVGRPKAWARQIMAPPGSAQPWHLHSQMNWEG